MRRTAFIIVFTITFSLFGLSLLPDTAVAQPTPCDGSTVSRGSYGSAILGQNMVYSIYLPPCYSQTVDPLPVVYLMHGSNDDDGHWVRLGLPEVLDRAIQVGGLPPMVVVMPFGNVIANRNQFEGVAWNRIFLEEFMPHVEANFHIGTTPDLRGIGGISRGGFWAYQIALSHPELFASVGGHSAFFDRYHAPPQHNPLDLALDAPDIATLRLWLDRGANDYAAPGLDLMHTRLVERGVEHQYTVYPTGQHNNDYWSQHIVTYLAFYAQPWIAARAGSPATVFVTNTPIATSTPSPAPTPTPAANARMLPVLLPAASFPSLQTSVERETLERFLAGGTEERLVLAGDIAALLENAGIAYSPETRIVEADALADFLRTRRDHFTLLPLERLDFDYRLLWMDDSPISEQMASYPLAFGNDAVASGVTRITFSGVTALTRRTRTALDENDITWAAEGIRAYALSSDFFHTSNEVSIVPTCPQGDNIIAGLAFCTKPEHMGVLDLIDADIIELSGNHNNDYGYDAYRETLAYYGERGMRTVGGGETVAEARAPLIIEHAGNRVGMLSCNDVGPYYALVTEDEFALGGVRPGAAACEEGWLREAIPDLAEQVDVVVVSVQAWELEQYVPSPQQRFDFRQLANWGADIVLGTSNHKPMTYEFYRTERGETAFIHYGLGNLFFDQPWWGNRRFFMDTVHLVDGRLRGIETFPGIIDDEARPRLMTAEERENFLFFMFVQQNGF